MPVLHMQLAEWIPMRTQSDTRSVLAEVYSVGGRRVPSFSPLPLNHAMSDAPCLFCRIASGEVPVTLIAENEHAVAFRDIAPKAPVHVLVIPRRHIASISQATNHAELGAVAALAAEVARQEGLEPAGYRIVTNTGADGGQSVLHLHFHVLGGRALGWPPG